MFKLEEGTELPPTHALIFMSDECKVWEGVKSLLEEIATELPHPIYLVDVFAGDWVTPLRDRYIVVGTPTFVYVREGVLASQVVGAEADKQYLRAIISDLL